MSDLLGLDQHNLCAGLNLLKKIRGPEPGIATAHDRDVRNRVGLKWRLCGVALEVIPPQGGAGLPVERHDEG